MFCNIRNIFVETRNLCDIIIKTFEHIEVLLMFIGVNSECIRFSGRWHVTDKAAVSTAPGSMIEFAFVGKRAVMHFDILTNEHPYPHMWIKVDRGTKVEVPLNQYLSVEAEEEEDGNHTVTLIFKGAVERQHRWYQPLIGKISFCGFEADNAGVLAEDNRKIIEFIGDSITEGVLIDAQYDPGKKDQPNRVYQDDVTATYAYIAAKELNLKPIFMAYGATGITRSGQGSVPKAAEAYPFCYCGVPRQSDNADYIVINHGTNDMHSPAEEYANGMNQFLKLVRTRNPKSKIAVMKPFYGCFSNELEYIISKYNTEQNDSVFLIDTSGWLPKLPVHPDRNGHLLAASKLIEVLKSWI